MAARQPCAKRNLRDRASDAGAYASPLIAAVFPPWREDGAPNRSTDVKGAVRPLHRGRITRYRQHHLQFEQIEVRDDEFAPVRLVVRSCVGALVEAAFGEDAPTGLVGGRARGQVMSDERCDRS